MGKKSAEEGQKKIYTECISIQIININNVKRQIMNVENGTRGLRIWLLFGFTIGKKIVEERKPKIKYLKRKLKEMCF